MRMDRILAGLIAMAGVGGVAGPALAQDAAPKEESPKQAGSPVPEGEGDRWKLDVSVDAWYVAPAGDLKMPASPALGAGDQYELADLNLDSPLVSPYAEIAVSRGKWGLGLSGFSFSASDRGFMPDGPGRLGDLTLTPGQQVKSDLDFASLAVTGSYRFYRYTNAADPDGNWALDSTLDAFVGARMYDVDFEFTSAAGREQTDEFFAEPIAGIKWNFDIGESFTISLVLGGGVGPWGDRSSWSFDVAPRFEWRPVRHIGLEVGYRLLVTDLSSGDGAEEFEWSGSMAGVLAGLTLRF